MDDQREVVEFLGSPAAHGGATPVERIETHGAYVFLAGDRACKIKRAVRYDYMDLSTVEKRRDLLRRELELNAPAAPGIYRDVVPLTREADGALAWQGQGPPVEWVLRMTRFPREAELEEIAEAGGIDDTLADRLGEEVARYHAAAPRRDADGATLIADILDELDRVFAELGQPLGQDRHQRFSSAVRERLQRAAPLLTRRSEAGHVRRCHGDLHLRNLVLIDGRPTPFDALEFDERLGTCDVLYDLAFLLMDLGYRGLDRAASVTFNSYLRAAPDEIGGLGSLPLFLSVRAAIRAMVLMQTQAASGRDLRTEAAGYFDAALSYLFPPPPALVVIGGLSGSGKTTLARSLAPVLGAAPGAVHLRSDVERKALFGTDRFAPLPQQAYAADVSARVYETIRRKAAQALAGGHAALVDAAHLSEAERAATEAAAGPHAFLGIWLQADADRLKVRVAARRRDESDADAEVVARQLSRPAGLIGWRVIDASGSPDDVQARARALCRDLLRPRP